MFWHRLIALCFYFSCFSYSAYAANAEQWRSRVIYQVLTDRFARKDGSTQPCQDLGHYCGGGYSGLTKNLDYIQGMGFNAIWISPIIDNYEGNYHGYAGRDIYKLNDNFGSQAEFIQFITQCHSRDIFVMVDVVANHMGNLDLDFSKNVPFNSSEHFHQYCIISDADFATHNQYNIENCRLMRLADLNQQNLFVKEKLLEWIQNLVLKYRIDGIRIDTVPQVPAQFWADFRASASVYAVGQVFDGDMGYLTRYIGPLDAVLNYPFFFKMRDVFFNSKDMYDLRSYYIDWSKHVDQNKLYYLPNFTDNHDNARVLSWSGVTWQKHQHLKSLNAFVLTSIGIPIVYYGTEQYFQGGNDPLNREVLWTNFNPDSEMYKFISTVNAARKKFQIWLQPQVQRYADHDIFVYSRGKFLVVLTNRVNQGVKKFISYHPFKSGDKICNVFNCQSDQIQVSDSGFQVYLANGEVKIYVPK